MVLPSTPPPPSCSTCFAYAELFLNNLRLNNVIYFYKNISIEQASSVRVHVDIEQAPFKL